MSQRDSGYERKERDLYETPEWVTEALLPHLPNAPLVVWEPACGLGKMSAVLRKKFAVREGDICMGEDFLEQPIDWNIDAIITNPPYRLAYDFIVHALTLTSRMQGIVAMLLRTDFDHAITRSNLFKYSTRFEKKIVLTKRIRWFEGSMGSPSFNHAWFIWGKERTSPPTLAYGP